MTLLRAAARTMLASFFVLNGAKALKSPAPMLAEAEPLAAKYVPLARRVLPVTVAPYLPENAKTLVRLNGAMQLLGGLSLATGLFRRGGAVMVASAMLPHVIASNPAKVGSAEDKALKRSQLSRNVALLGGALLAAQDTEGKPSLAWRAADQQRRLAKEAAKTRKRLQKQTARLKTTKDAGTAAAKLVKRTGAAKKVARQEAKKKRAIASAVS